MTTTRTGYNEYVSREELAAHLGPINQSLSDIRTDVKALLAFQAGARAVSSWQRFWIGTVAVGLIGAIATIAWLAAGF
jgi:hypothetical protein